MGRASFSEGVHCCHGNPKDCCHADDHHTPPPNDDECDSSNNGEECNPNVEETIASCAEKTIASFAEQASKVCEDSSFFTEEQWSYLDDACAWELYYESNGTELYSPVEAYTPEDDLVALANEGRYYVWYDINHHRDSTWVVRLQVSSLAPGRCDNIFFFF